MMTRYLDRRRCIRVPASGPAQWESGPRRGTCQLLDLSPQGVAVRMPIRRASQLEDRARVRIELEPGVLWSLAGDARVVRRIPDTDGQCVVGLEFEADR